MCAVKLHDNAFLQAGLGLLDRVVKTHEHIQLEA
jgi:hypothetical protein